MLNRQQKVILPHLRRLMGSRFGGELSDRELLERFIKAEEPDEESREKRLPSGERVILYYGALRATGKCLTCHQQLAEQRGVAKPAENDLMAVIDSKSATLKKTFASLTRSV